MFFFFFSFNANDDRIKHWNIKLALRETKRKKTKWRCTRIKTKNNQFNVLNWTYSLSFTILPLPPHTFDYETKNKLDFFLEFYSLKIIGKFYGKIIIDSEFKQEKKERRHTHFPENLLKEINRIFFYDKWFVLNQTKKQQKIHIQITEQKPKQKISLENHFCKHKN